MEAIKSRLGVEQMAPSTNLTLMYLSQSKLEENQGKN